MRDPFESSPALRLGDAKAKPWETGILQGAEIVAIEPPKTDTAIPRPPSLAPEFGDAFGAALSKPSREALAAVLGNVAHETRHPVGDGAMRYEPRGFVEIRPEVLSEAEFKRRQPPLDYQYVDGMLYSDFLIERLGWTPDRPTIDHGDTSPAALLNNHTSLVAKKGAEK